MFVTSMLTVHQTGPAIPAIKVTVAQQTPHPEMTSLAPGKEPSVLASPQRIRHIVALVASKWQGFTLCCETLGINHLSFIVNNVLEILLELPLDLP